jgi:hypothetical protein
VASDQFDELHDAGFHNARHAAIGQAFGRNILVQSCDLYPLVITITVRKRSAEVMATKYDVESAVIGAGIVGIATAYYLAV